MSKVYACVPDFDKGETYSPFGPYCRVFLVCRTTGNWFLITDNGEYAGTEQEHEFTGAYRISFDDDNATTEGMATVFAYVPCRPVGKAIGKDEPIPIVRNHDCSGLAEMSFRHYVRLKPKTETVVVQNMDAIDPDVPLVVESSS